MRRTPPRIFLARALASTACDGEVTGTERDAGRIDASAPSNDGGGRDAQLAPRDGSRRRGLPHRAAALHRRRGRRGRDRARLRFILPSDRVRERTYAPPATHGTDTTGSRDAPPYGVHFRLRRDYPLDTLPSEGARVVARALQRFGMYHADGGNIALTAQSDRHTTAKWDELIAPRDLAALRVEDFEVIDHGEPVPVTYECVREP